MNKKQMAKIVGKSLVEALEIVENELGPEIRLGLETANAKRKAAAKAKLDEITKIVHSNLDDDVRALHIFAKALDLEEIILGADNDD